MRLTSRARAGAIGALALAGLLTGPAVTAAPASADVPGPVVLLGTGGVRWADVDGSTPALARLRQEGSIGWLAARSVRAQTCPVDGWLAVSAGKRAADVAVGAPADRVDEAGPSCRDLPADIPRPGGPGSLPRWDDYVAEAEAGTFEAVPGLLGQTLAAAGEQLAAVGPGAVVALADPSGSTPAAWPGRTDGPAGEVPAQALAGDVRAALATGPDLLVVDLGAVRDPARRFDGEPALTGAWARPRAEQVHSLDTRLGLVLAQLPAGATVIVGSLADSGTPAQLQLLAARGPAPEGGTFATSLLGTRSTRQDGLAQTTDLLPTLLAALSVPVPVTAVGSPLQPVAAGGSAARRTQAVDDLAQASFAVHPIVPWIVGGAVALQLVLYGGTALRLRRPGGPATGAALGRLRDAAVVFSSFPAATFLANLLPWWRAGRPGLAATGAVILFMVPISAFALLGPWRRAPLGPAGAIGAATALVLAADAGTGSHLVLSSLMGVQPIVAGRFYGFSNPTFALFATGALLFAVAVADELVKRDRARAAGLAVAATGLVATLIDGAPGIGSDFGGPPAILPAFGVLALMVAGVAVTWRRALGILAVTVAVIVALGVADWLRPAEKQTHLGRFVQTALDGGAGPVIRRKAVQNFDLLFASPLSALLPFVVVLVVLVLARPVRLGVAPLQAAYDRSPVLKPGLLAFGVMMLIGALLNDSGAAVPAVAAVVLLPLLVAVSAAARQRPGSGAAAGPPGGAAGPGPRPGTAAPGAAGHPSPSR